MRKIWIACLGCLLACAKAGAAEPFVLTSPSFHDGTPLAVRNAGNDPSNPMCVGQNISPALNWTAPPAGTKSFVLMLFDPEGRLGLGVSHWVSYGIAVDVTGLAEGEASQPFPKFVAGKGTRGMFTYVGPCPPAGTGLHHYTFTLIATDLAPDALAPGMTRDEVLARLDGHAKGAAGLIGLFGHPGDKLAASGSVAPVELGVARQELAIRLAQYADAVRNMETETLANMFAEGGAISNAGSPPIAGRDAIRSYLHAFRGYKVITESIYPDTTVVNGSTATQMGAYGQTALTPEGQTVHVQGRFQASWTRSPSGTWLLAEMKTLPTPIQ